MIEKQLVQKRLAVMQTKHDTALSACFHVAESVDDGEENTLPMVSMVKRNSCMETLDLLDFRDILGGNGIMDEIAVFRHMCNLETVNTYEGTADIHALIIGKEITGAFAF